MRVPGNTPYIRTPRVQKRSSKRTIIIMLVTIVLPPLGLILLWRVARCPLRGKVLITMLGAAIMVLAFALYMGSSMPIGVDVPIEYQYPSVTRTPAEQAESVIVDPPPGEDPLQNDDDSYPVVDLNGEDGVIPAKPD